MSLTWNELVFSAMTSNVFWMKRNLLSRNGKWNEKAVKQFWDATLGQFHQHAYVQLLHVQMLLCPTSISPTKLCPTSPEQEFTLNFYAVRYKQHTSMIGVNLLSQKLFINCWWNWPLVWNEVWNFTFKSLSDRRVIVQSYLIQLLYQN